MASEEQRRPRREAQLWQRAKRLTPVALPMVIVAALVLYGMLLLPARPIAWIALGAFGLLAYVLWRFR